MGVLNAPTSAWATLGVRLPQPKIGAHNGAVVALTIALTSILLPGAGITDRALSLMDRIAERFGRPDGDYSERWLATSGGQDLAYNWSVGVWLEAHLDASAHSPAWKQKTAQYLDRVDRYWVQTGFGVLPGNKERYYDDNAWMVLAFARAANVTGDPRWKKRAGQALDFVLSGEDAQLGGGIFWKEPQKLSKHTCSNAPAVVGCLLLDRLDNAKRIYAWTRKTLRDPADGLYWDNVRLDGTVEKTKWSYNSGLMLRAAHLLHQKTGDKRYERDMNEIKRSGWRRWADEQAGEFRCEGRFAHLFLDAFWEAANPTEKTKLRALVAKLADREDANGFYGKRWYKTSTPASSYELIDQASMARAMFIAARD